MYRCPNCSAGMRYDIYKRSLKCDYCGYICAAENHPQQQEEAARDDYEVTLFSCPQCGGEAFGQKHQPREDRQGQRDHQN